MSRLERNKWIEQTKAELLANEKMSDHIVKEMIFLYDEAANQIETSIDALFGRYATNNALSLAEAQKLLSGQEYSVWKKSIEEYFLQLKVNPADSKTLMELNTLAMKGQISRQEQMLSNVYRNMATLADKSASGLDTLLGDVLRVNSYQTMFHAQKAAGLAFGVPRIDEKLVRQVLDYPWAQKKFSKAVWDNVDKLTAVAKREITLGIINGSGSRKIAKNIEALMGKGKEVAERLARTESHYFAYQGRLQAWKENGIKKYKFLGNNEAGHCSCGGLNGRVFEVDQAEVNINYPPIHPNCRCSVIAYFENGIFSDKKTEPFDDKLTLKSWEEKYVEDAPPKGYRDFNVEEKREAYKNFLKNVPQKNKMYLEYYNGNTEYEQSSKIKSTFGYHPKHDKIYYNSEHPLFEKFDFNVANTHELAHRIDVLNFKSWENEDFVKAVTDGGKSVLGKVNYFEKLCEEDREGFLSDIISALSSSKIELRYGHDMEYWQTKGNKEKEIFANLFAMEAFQDKRMKDVEASLPKLMEAYHKLYL